MPRRPEPFLWALFSAGGTVAAFVLPALFGVLFVAVPLGWAPAPSHGWLHGLLTPPISRLLLFGLVSLSLFHWAHRFRYTLYDGLQLYHLRRLVAAVTYGTATVLTAASAVVLWAL